MWQPGRGWRLTKLVQPQKRQHCTLSPAYGHCVQADAHCGELAALLVDGGASQNSLLMQVGQGRGPAQAVFVCLRKDDAHWVRGCGQARPQPVKYCRRC